MPGHALIPHPTVGPCVTLEEMANTVGLHPDLVRGFVVYGLLEPLNLDERVQWFDVRAVRQLRTIRRLREDLGINLPGIAAVLELLERTERLRRELADLRR